MESHEDTNPDNPSKNERVEESAVNTSDKTDGVNESSMEHPSKKEQSTNIILIASACVGALTLTVYCLTLFTTTAGGDSGEILAVACSGGVLHPPGYPLISILGQIAAALPGSREPAWRIGYFVSALPSAGASSILCANLILLTNSVLVGCLCSLLYAFSSLIWTYATTVEVFAINNCVLSAIFLIATLFERASRQPRASQQHVSSLFCAGAFLVGVGLCNQHTLILAAAPIAIWAICIAAARRLLTVGLLLRSFLALVAGLTPYIYLPLAASSPDRAPGSAPIPRWGGSAASTAGGFMHHVLRRDYGTFSLVPDTGLGEGVSTTPSLAAGLRHYLHWLPSQLAAGLGLPAALSGLAVAVVGRKTPDGVGAAWAGRLAVACIAVYLGVFFSLANADVSDDHLVSFWQCGAASQWSAIATIQVEPIAAIQVEPTASIQVEWLGAGSCRSVVARFRLAGSVCTRTHHYSKFGRGRYSKRIGDHDNTCSLRAAHRLSLCWS